MDMRSLPAFRGRALLLLCLFMMGAADALAQQPSNTLALTPGARPGGNIPNLASDYTLLLAQEQSELFEIPPMIERPLGMEEGPRILVSDFALSGAVDREEQALRVSDLEAILGGHVRSQPAGGFTINQLQSIADEITSFYRERGFIIAQAIVPAQEVRNGIIDIHVLEGLLGEVEIEGNRVYRSSVVGRPLTELQGQPIVQESIEQALLDIQDLPGLTVFGTFTRGDQLGDTDLVVRVQEERQLYVTPSVDNFGSGFTGEFRGLLDFQINNLWGVADQMSGYILQTFDPSNGTYGGVNIEVPIGRSSIGVGGFVNQFDVGGLEDITNLAINGTVEQADIFWDHTFSNGRFLRSSGRLGLAFKNAVTESDTTDAILAEDNLTVFNLAFDIFSASRRGRGYILGSFGVEVGVPNWLGSMEKSGGDFPSRRGGDDTFAGGDFSKITFNFQQLRQLNANNALLLRIAGQWTDDMLVSLEQYAIGGPQNVRAYAIADALVDTAVSATLEWFINAPGFSNKPTRGNRTWGEVFQVSLFADYSYGEVNNPRVTQESTVDYSGYGLGLQFNFPGSFFARFDVASPIGSRIADNDRDPQFYFRMSYEF